MTTAKYAHLARPDLPQPNCVVMLVCGPPASGKTTYVRNHARPHDVVIDVDQIAEELGVRRYGMVDTDDISEVLAIRNERLAALAHERSDRVAWFIVCAASPALRQWWCDVLGVKKQNMILLVPPQHELIRRIHNDPNRAHVQLRHINLVDQWFRRERLNDPHPIKPDTDYWGMPTDPLHHWNR